MTQQAIYINNIVADLSDDTIIATTFQAWNVSKLTSRNVSHTNRIKLPWTPTNIEIYEFANDVKSKTRKPYVSVSVRVVINGDDIFSNGFGLLIRSSSFLELDIFDRGYEFFQIIKGRYVDELDLEVYGPVDPDFVDDRNATNSVGTPVIDYGRMFAPPQVLGNDLFDPIGDSFDPWGNTEIPSFTDSLAQLWEVVSVINVKVGVVLGTTGSTCYSAWLDGPYKFYKGFEYRIVLICEVTSGTTAGSIQIELHNDQGFIQLLSSEPITTVGIHTIDVTFTVADRDFNFISIFAEQSPGGTVKTLQLLKMDIIPTNIIDVKPPYYLPAVGFSTIFQAIIDASGYQYTLQGGTVHLDNLMVSFSKQELRYNRRLLDKYDFQARALGTQSFNATSTFTKVQFTEMDSNGVNSWFDLLDDIVIPLFDFDLRIKIYVRLTVDITINTGASTVVIGLRDNATFQTDEGGNFLSEEVTSNGTYTFDFELPLTKVGNDGKSYNVAIGMGGGGQNADIVVESGILYLKCDNVPVDRIHISNLVLPDMLQTDFVAEYLFRIGGLINERSSVLNLKTIQSIIENRKVATDWTNKRDTSIQESIDFVSSDYAKRNYFSDSPVDALNAKGVMLIDNENLAEEKTIYSSVMIVPEEIQVNGIKILRIPVFDFETNDPLTVSGDFEPGMRLFYSRFDDNDDPEVLYNGTTESIYTVGVYSDPIFDAQGTWQYFIDTYYPGLKKAFDDLKILTRGYMLSDIDVKTKDILTLVLDDNVYYLIIKIPNYVSGKSTKVQLLKVS